MDKIFGWVIAGQINVLSFVVTAFGFGVMAMLWSSRGHLHCTDLITDKTGKISRVAIGECMAIIIAVLVPVWQTVQGKLDFDILATCLVFLGGSSGFAKYLRWKADLHAPKPPEGSNGSQT